ncbi:MAG TPA: hypothetical protein VGB72_08085 [Acidobacteriota bacterium]
MKLNPGGLEKTFGIAGIFLLSLLIIASGPLACKKKAAEPAAGEATDGKVTKVQEGLNEFEGTVKVAYGPYLYVPEVLGFDIVLPLGQSGSELEGKAVRIKGDFDREKPSILLVTSLDVKEPGENYKNFFGQSGQEQWPDFLNQRDRNNFPILKIAALNKAEAWEGKGQGKVFGKMEKMTVTEGGAQKEVVRLALADDKGVLIGKVILDSLDDYAAYYIKKLRLFDSFWFYLKVKDSVDLKTRTATKDLFHADVVFAGLY